MLTKVKCPLCKRHFELNEAVDSHLREEILSSANIDHQKQLEEVRNKAIEETQRKAEEENRKKLEETRKQAYDDAVKSVSDKNAIDVSFMQKQISEKDEKIKEFREQELELRKQKSEIEESKKEIELTVQRRVDEEKKKAEQAATDRIEKDFKLKLAEKDQHIESMSKKIEELQKKSNLTSQQLQGEVLELAVQQKLEESFTDDEITEIEKFKNGADIKQMVRSRKGLLCGKILWECKRTNEFKTTFITKLKDDMLREEASFGIIVSTTLPKQALHGMAQIDGIWICSQAFVESLGIILRESLISVARVKWINDNKGNKGDQLIEYFNSTSFAQKIQELAGSLHAERVQVNKERSVYTKMWTDRETQIDRKTRSIAKILSSIQGFVGSGMQNIEAFDLLSLNGGQE
jgi:hypothetical protein